MVFCSKCGTELNEETFFCTNCGARTARGDDEGVEPHWKKELEEALQKASKSLDAGFREAMQSLENVARDIKPELEEAKEGLREAAEDVGAGIRGAAERLKGRRRQEYLHCSACGKKNIGTAKYCNECGKPIA
jgi:membrane protease subunit (stomatin/prohibitin family)